MIPELIKLAELKSRLIEYAKSERFRAIHDRVLTTVFTTEGDGATKRVDPSELAPEEYYNFLDWFALELRHEDDRTILDRFLEENRSALGAWEYQAADSWRNVFESIFKIKCVMDDGFYALNLLNLKNYILKPTIPMDDFGGIDKGAYISARVVPFRDFHVFSGAMMQFGFETPQDAVNYITDIISDQPGLYFQDNPEGLETAQKLQEREREIFRDHFGDDVFISEGREFRRNYEDFFKKSSPAVKELRDSFRRSVGLASAVADNDELPEAHGLDAVLDEYSALETVGIIYDGLEGINFYPDFREFEAVFSGEQAEGEESEEGAAEAGTRQRDIIVRYLEDERISTLPFIKMFERYPGNARIVFAGLFGIDLTGFDHTRDLQKYLFPYKSYFYKTRPIPSLLPVEMKDFVAAAIGD